MRKRIYTGLWVVAGLLVVLFAYQAVKATSALKLAAVQAGVLQRQIAGGDVASAEVTLDGLRQSTGQARDSTDGLMWDIGARIPWLGQNLAAVQSVSAALDEVATDALPPIVSVAEQVNTNTFSPKDGKLDLAALSSIEPSVGRAADALTKAKEEISAIDAEGLLTPLEGPVRTVQQQITTAQSAAASGHLAAKLLPTMLGGEGKRRYVLLIQNNAEVRSMGGIVGSYAFIGANKGRIAMGDQGTVRDLTGIEKPVVKPSEDEKAVYPTSMFTDLRNVVFTPDFPRAAEITSAIFKQGIDEDIDGVISVDPIALSYLLKGTGPVTLEDGTVLTDENATQILLNQVYIDNPTDPFKQDDIYASAAREIFDVVKEGTGESRLVIGGLAQAAVENRLMLWSANDDEQRQLSGSRVSGELAGDAGSTPHVGVYLNDGASTKMEYYLDYFSTLFTEKCLKGGIQQLSTRTSLISDAPSNVADLFVAGAGGFVPRGVMLINVRIYSPHGGAVTKLEVNGKEQSISPAKHKGRNVVRASVRIKPGETHVITTTMLSGPDQKADAIFSTTPGVNPTRNNVVTKSAC